MTDEEPLETAARIAAATASSPPAERTSMKPVQQMTKLRDANAKYKSLLKLAKERIQAQEEELEQLRAETKRLEAQVSLVESSPPCNNNNTVDNSIDALDSSSCVVRVIQLVESENEIWALVEFDASVSDSIMDAPKRFVKKWKSFSGSQDLADFLRRDTGEPIVLPPYSLSPSQSAEIQEEANLAVSRIQEEYRRFRVKSEIAKKQADAQIRELHSQSIEKTQMQVEGRGMQQTRRSDKEQKLQQEMQQQESRWKEAYNVLMAENKALKSTGSEALLASQWRQRYEVCQEEKQELASKLEMELEKATMNKEERRRVDAGKYEQKYRDLKESFRLYRVKAKEIFEAQQRGDVSPLLQLSQNGSEDAKLSYLKNLMVNYLSSDDDVREHMEGAIGTVLKFSDEDKARIKQKRAQDENWFGISVSN